LPANAGNCQQMPEDRSKIKQTEAKTSKRKQKKQLVFDGPGRQENQGFQRPKALLFIVSEEE